MTDIEIQRVKEELRGAISELETRQDKQRTQDKLEIRASIRTVHDRVDVLGSNISEIPGRVLESIVPLISAGKGNGRQPSWYEVIPWTWAFVCTSVLGLVVLMGLGIANPDDAAALVSAFRQATP